MCCVVCGRMAVATHCVHAWRPAGVCSAARNKPARMATTLSTPPLPTQRLFFPHRAKKHIKKKKMCIRAALKNKVKAVACWGNVCGQWCVASSGGALSMVVPPLQTKTNHARAATTKVKQFEVKSVCFHRKGSKIRLGLIFEMEIIIKWYEMK